MAESTEWRHQCPWCGTINEAATGVDGTHPDVGAVGICWNCHQLGVVDMTPYGLVMRKPTHAEELRFAADPQILELLTAVATSYSVQEAAAYLRPESEHKRGHD